MSDDKQSTASPTDRSRIQRWSRGLQGQLLKAAEHTQTAAGIAEGAAEKLKLMLNSPTAQTIIASATSEPAKKIAIDSLYLLLPQPIRWAVKPELFEAHVRRHVFRESGETLKIVDQSVPLSPEDAGDSGS
jgi:hypothetical protein